MPPKAYAEQWDIDGLDEKVKSTLGLELPLHDWAAEEGVSNEEIEERVQSPPPTPAPTNGWSRSGAEPDPRDSRSSSCCR